MTCQQCLVPIMPEQLLSCQQSGASTSWQEYVPLTRGKHRFHVSRGQVLSYQQCPVLVKFARGKGVGGASAFACGVSTFMSTVISAVSVPGASTLRQVANSVLRKPPASGARYVSNVLQLELLNTYCELAHHSHSERPRATTPPVSWSAKGDNRLTMACPALQWG